MRKLYTIDEVAKRVRKSLKFINDLIDSGELKGFYSEQLDCVCFTGENILKYINREKEKKGGKKDKIKKNTEKICHLLRTDEGAIDRFIKLLDRCS